ncbi:MAG: hypothetical protein WDW38_000921 [Sanguina aurantia]
MRCAQRRTALGTPHRDRRRNNAASLFDDPISARQPHNPDPELINEDFAPTPDGVLRTWDAHDFAMFWITLVISITTYYLAASLVDLGMSWWQGILTVFISNLITLVPMVLNAHPGTKWGVPFPVLARASFGIQGAHLPSLSRALVAAGWFGIQTWIGGSAIHKMLTLLSHGRLEWLANAMVIPALGITGPEFGCFMVFWLLQVVIVTKGMESIRVLEKASAPLLIALSAALLWWAVTTAGGFGPMLSAPSQFEIGGAKAGQFWNVFFPAVTANVGYWGTLSLNIPDFTRYAKSQGDQLWGQAIGLPIFMALFTFLGLAVTSATIVIYGHAISDPVQLLGRMEGLAPICLSLFGLMWATLTTNIAANIVAPANAFVNIAPNKVSFNAGALVTALLGVLLLPWKLISSSGAFLGFLVGYSALLGPVIGIVMCDYFIIRHRHLDIDSLYRNGPTSAYWYQGGWNLAAIGALILGVLPSLPGFLSSVGVLQHVHPLFASIYDVSWFVGVGVSTVVYLCLMRLMGQGGETDGGGKGLVMGMSTRDARVEEPRKPSQPETHGGAHRARRDSPDPHPTSRHGDGGGGSSSRAARPPGKDNSNTNKNSIRSREEGRHETDNQGTDRRRAAEGSRDEGARERQREAGTDRPRGGDQQRASSRDGGREDERRSGRGEADRAGGVERREGNGSQREQSRADKPPADSERHDRAQQDRHDSERNPRQSRDDAQPRNKPPSSPPLPPPPPHAPSALRQGDRQGPAAGGSDAHTQPGPHGDGVRGGGGPDGRSRDGGGRGEDRGFGRGGRDVGGGGRSGGGRGEGGGRGRGRGRGSDRDQDASEAEHRRGQEEEGEPGPTAPKEVVNLGLSGKLAAETNKVDGVELKHQPPPDAHKPDKRWRLYVFKNGKAQDEPIHLHRNDHYLFGRDFHIADIAAAHPSVSKQHAVVQFRQVSVPDEIGLISKGVRPYIIDLDTVNGTFLNTKRLESLRQPLTITLRGITNDGVDVGVDTFRTVTLPLLKRLGIEEGLELRVVRRGAAPAGGGEVVLKVPVVKQLTAINLTDEGMIKRIRGVAYSMKVSPQNTNRMVDGCRRLLNSLLADVYIFTDAVSGKESGLSPGYGMTLVAETTSGPPTPISTPSSSSAPHTSEPLIVPEDIGTTAASLLMEEVSRGGVVDGAHQPLLLTLAALGPEEANQLRLGPLTPQAVSTLRHLQAFFDVTFGLQAERESKTIFMTCIGAGIRNLSKKVT